MYSGKETLSTFSPDLRQASLVLQKQSDHEVFPGITTPLPVSASKETKSGYQAGVGLEKNLMQAAGDTLT